LISDRSFPDGKYVECRVLKGIPKHALVDVSLRDSRVEGDLDDDDPPEAGDTVQGYVVETNKKGCFVRLSRNVEGRVTLKELCDGFLPDPKASFPSGRLVVGRVKEIRDARKKANNSVKFQVDLDMRESTLLDQMKKLSFEDIKLQRKYKGTVARVESYGVFVQIENSNVSGLTHMSECSDKFIKNLGALYDPGDLVKVLVIKKDTENKNLGFSMKASHFEDDTDSEDDSSIGNASSEDEDMIDIDGGNDGASDDLDSDDENFGAKLAVRLNKDAASDDDESNGSFSDSESEADEEDSSGSDDDNDTKSAAKPLLDINVGFDWGAKGMSVKNSVGIEDDSSKSDSDSSDSEDDGMDKSSSHKSRKKQARRRREEQEITRRESALADGTADENPETAGDFERLLAGNPNSSELWIRYMAFYLSLADIPSARKIAEKGLARIEFREEKEILNVWTALLTLEHKYGTYISLQGTVDEACGHCNPKQVYLRVCEILEKDSSSSPESVNRANDMFAKMCKKFKSKKKVWLAHLEYLLKQSQHQEAHALLKRAILSLAAYKHAETMSKFAQLEFEYGSAERARTVFDGIVEKYPRRLDLFFVYLDKEVKFGKVSQARALLERKVEEDKLSDKQMKSLFKKWFRMEEQHGNKDDQERVKDTARKYVQK
jgi:rRNA biogenesis protein RRP5